jgi:Flp pilus assembly protein TadG
MKKRRMKTLKGSATIEMAYIAPMTLLMIMVIITIVFYFYDKNVIIGGAMETATIAAQLERQEKEDIEMEIQGIFEERVRNKLIMFTNAQVQVEKSSRQVTVYVTASKGPRVISVTQRAEIPTPEEKIRSKNRIWRIWDE